MSQTPEVEPHGPSIWRKVGFTILIAIFFYPILIALWSRMVVGVFRVAWSRKFASPSNWGRLGFSYWIIMALVYLLGTLIVLAPLIFEGLRRMGH